MASSKEYLIFILEQLSGLDDITYRAMMGEYILYYRERVIGGIYDDRFLVKPVRAAVNLMPNAETEVPYEGAKGMLLVDDVDDREYLVKLFEAILEKINQKDEMNFQKEIEDGMAATDILDRALALMRNEMEHSEDSLSLAMYEYSGTCSNDRMNYFNRIGEKKWSDLIEYGIVRGEFNTVNVKEIVHVILYAYQGVRMWSRIVSMTPEVYDSITNHIRKQLIKEQ